MQRQTNEPPLLLVEVEEHSDRRCSTRSPANSLHAELRLQSYPHLIECTCLNFSSGGISVLADLKSSDQGSRVCVNLVGQGQRIMGLTGRILRCERTGQFTKVAIAFDEVHGDNPNLKRLIESGFSSYQSGE